MEFALLEFASVDRSSQDLIAPLLFAQRIAADGVSACRTVPVRVFPPEREAIAPLSNARTIATGEESVKDLSAFALRSIRVMIVVSERVRTIAIMLVGAITASVSASLA